MIAPFLLVALTHGYTLKEGVTPVQKVIQMLQDMSAKGAAEKAAEEKTFVQYKQFCDTETASKTAAIKKAGEDVEMLIADIQKAMSDSAVAAKKIAELDKEIARLDAAKTESNEVADKDRADYLKEHADYSESVDSLARGIQQLQSGSVPSFVQGERREALLQLQRITKMPVHAKRVLTSFLETAEDPEFSAFDREAEAAGALSVSAPESASYGFQSGGVVDMLKKLLSKFKDELNTLEKEEMMRKGAHDVVIQDLNRQIEAATTTKDLETATKAERDSTAAEKKGLLADTKKAKADDEEYLSTLKAECAMAAEDFENRQQLRVEEMEAIEKATAILKSGSVTGMADKHLPGFMQTGAFPLLRARGTHPTTASISKFLEGRAERTGSKLLSMVAQKVDAAAKIPGFDPISQVKKMMQDMIVQLMEQANEEASAKLWCDTELSTNKQTRDTKTDGVTSLTTEKDKLTADIAKLGEEIAELTKAIAEIDAAVAEATLMRQEEKATNAETVSDAQEAQVAVSQALTVLKEFYRKAATATALVQIAHKEEPKKNPFQEAYTGMGGENTGVVGMLEVIGTDFARLESETEAAEEQAAKEFHRFSIASAKDKSVKNQEMQDRINLQVTKKAALTDTDGDLKAMQAELDTALVYYDKLKPSCVSSGDKYAERVARRQEEITSLEQCLKFFEGNDLPPME
jgi:hypothetical protein